MSMRSVTLNEGLEEIKSFAFYKCNNLTTLDIPASLTSIDFAGNAFGGCTNLQAINVAQGNTSYSSASGIVYNAAGTELIFCPAALAAENLTFPAALTKIGTNAFKNNTSIKTVTFPASLTEIGNDAFSGCTGITTLAFPASLQKIGEYAFSGCTGVYDIALNEGLQTVEISAFKGCTALTTIKIPASVTTWKWSATINCTNLAAFEVAAGSTSYHTDGPSLIEDATATLLQYAPAAPAQYYKVPDGVTKINAFAFDGVKALKILDTNQVLELGNDAICVLDELTDLTLGAATSAGDDESAQLGVLLHLGDGERQPLCARCSCARLQAEYAVGQFRKHPPYESGARNRRAGRGAYRCGERHSHRVGAHYPSGQPRHLRRRR